MLRNAEVKQVKQFINSNSVNVGSEIIFQDKTCRDSEEVCNEWGSYFSSLYSDAENAYYDSDHFNDFTERVNAIKQNVLKDNSVVSISEGELNTAIAELSRGKASGEGRIDNKHIVHSGPLFRKTILLLLNAMLLN